MIKNKNSRIAIWAVFSKGTKICIAPITLYILSSNLSSEELSYYYTFFSFLALQQIVELGVGHVIRQFISHEYYEDNTGSIKTHSLLKVKELFLFSMVWFLGIAIFVFFIVGISGYLFFNSSTQTTVNWELAWILLITAQTFSIFSLPVQLLLDGIQKQNVVIKASLIGGVINAISIWLLISNNIGLCSIGISVFMSSLITLVYMLMSNMSFIKKLYLAKVNFEIKAIFSEVFPLLKRVSIVWGVGFLFWNGFTLITFKALPPDESGVIIFTLAISKAGYDIAASITTSQFTLYSNLISKGKYTLAKDEFNKYYIISVVFLFTGYLSFIIGKLIFPSLDFFQKTANIYISIQIFIFYILVLFKNLKCSYVRCYKIEPFVSLSIIESILVPLIYLLSLYIMPHYAFFMCSIIVIFVAFKAFNIANKSIYER